MKECDVVPSKTIHNCENLIHINACPVKTLLMQISGYTIFIHGAPSKCRIETTSASFDQRPINLSALIIVDFRSEDRKNLAHESRKKAACVNIKIVVRVFTVV